MGDQSEETSTFPEETSIFDGKVVDASWTERFQRTYSTDRRVEANCSIILTR